jgi:hypothetical protein
VPAYRRQGLPERAATAGRPYAIDNINFHCFRVTIPSDELHPIQVSLWFWFEESHFYPNREVDNIRPAFHQIL